MNAPDTAAGRPDLARIEAILGHRFADHKQLKAAATHPSGTARRGGGIAFERLEFLGDRVLGLVVADLLCARLPQEREGDLALRFTALVRRESLHDLMRDTGLAEAIVLGPGGAGGGQGMAVVLSDTCEALLAALYLDGGLAPVRRFLESALAGRLDRPAARAKDAKTALQELAMARGWPLPSYSVIASEGPAHDPSFHVRVDIAAPVASPPFAEGRGRAKREAEQAAAAALLARLTGEGDG